MRLQKLLLVQTESCQYKRSKRPFLFSTIGFCVRVVSKYSSRQSSVIEALHIENQKAILLQYARDHRFPNPSFFIDDGYSGVTYDRPGFQKMLDEIEAGHVATVITKDLSRLGRNSALTGLYINYTFPQNDVRYIAVNDPFDSINPNSTDSDIAGIKKLVQ